MSEITAESETSENRSQIQPIPDHDVVLIVVKILIATLFIFPLAHYSIYKHEDLEQEATVLDHQDQKQDERQEEEAGPIFILNKKVLKPKKIIKQPSCPLIHPLVILQNICTEYVFQRTKCIPSDFKNPDKHKLPPRNSGSKSSAKLDARDNIVGVLACGLLLISLGAAFVELYKAKCQSPAKSKAALTNKLSLADLTILKHHRKELIRRDSILEYQSEIMSTSTNSSTAASSAQPGHTNPAPLVRRCSFPVAPSDPSINVSSTTKQIGKKFDNRYSISETGPVMMPEPRRLSIVDGKLIMEKRSSILERRYSVRDYRRPSVYEDAINTLPNGISSSRRVSEVDDFEKKHHPRLVHRH